MDNIPPGSLVPGILQARTLEWVAISFSNVWKWKVKVKSLSCVCLLATPWTTAYQAPPSMGFSRQEYWSGLPLPSPDTPMVTLIHFTNIYWSLWFVPYTKVNTYNNLVLFIITTLYARYYYLHLLKCESFGSEISKTCPSTNRQSWDSDPGLTPNSISLETAIYRQLVSASSPTNNTNEPKYFTRTLCRITEIQKRKNKHYRIF